MKLRKKQMAFKLFLVASFWVPLVSHAEVKTLYQQNINYILSAIDSFNHLILPKGCSLFKRPISEKQKWEEAGFGNPQITSINLSDINEPNKTFTHEFNLSLVMFRNTGWTSELIERHLRQVGEIYAQCGIRLGKAKLVIVDAPDGKIDIEEKGTGRDLDIARRTPTTEKPTIYFVRSNFDAYAAWAYPEYTTENNAYRDTAWITNDVNLVSRKKPNNAKYNSLAHELAHVFGNCSHVTDDSANILADTFEKLNGTILPKQCDQFKKHRSMRKL